MQAIIQQGKALLPRLFVASVSALAIGHLGYLFLLGMQFAENTRHSVPLLVLGLPFGGLLIVWLYKTFGKEAQHGNKDLMERSQEGKELPAALAPLIVLSTCITHLFGGSAGREGTALQLGAGLADNFQRLFKTVYFRPQEIVAMGAAAGFGAVFGTPLTAIVFAWEVVLKRKWDSITLFWISCTTFLAYLVPLFWGVAHSHYAFVFPTSDWAYALFVAVLISPFFGLIARGYFFTLDGLKEVFTKSFKNPYTRIFIGGAGLASLFLFLPLDQYHGLGIPHIQDAFLHQAGLEVPWLKLLFTALTLAIGFKGGEVTPLFFVGASLGSCCAGFLGLPVGFLAGLGFIALFSGASKAYLACAFMGAELFGWVYFPLFLFVCLLASNVTGKRQLL